MNEYEGSVRIGPITLFTFIAVLCLATLAVLSIATARASQNMAELQGESMALQYEADAAAQRFVALLDEQGSGALQEAALTAMGQSVADEFEGIDTVSASIDGNTVYAELTCSNERMLDIAVELRSDGTYEVRKWNMTAKRNTAEADKLWSGI